jgi:hypothetical protein
LKLWYLAVVLSKMAQLLQRTFLGQAQHIALQAVRWIGSTAEGSGWGLVSLRRYLRSGRTWTGPCENLEKKV